MEFLTDYLPLLLVIHGPRFDDAELAQMKDGYETYFRKKERYAVLVVAPGEHVAVAARERQRITEWVNTPRVKELSGKLCVGSAVVVPSTVARCTMTALLWFWSPPSPLRVAATVPQAFDTCVQLLGSREMKLARAADVILDDIVRRLRARGGFAPSLGAG